MLKVMRLLHKDDKGNSASINLFPDSKELSHPETGCLKKQPKLGINNNVLLPGIGNLRPNMALAEQVLTNG